MTDICYYCGKAATSDEHVPPKTIFPKQKDSLDGRDYRRNLIKVRSCDEHNSAKSRDDEYLLYTLAMSLPSNGIATHQFLTKVQRAAQRKPALLNSLLIEFKNVTIHDTDKDVWYKSIAIRPDQTRLTNIFTHIAKAIYFLETGCVWQGKNRVHIDFMISLQNAAQNEHQAETEKLADQYLAAIPHKGMNQDIFSYQFVEHEGQAMLRLYFYGSSKVLSVFV